MYMDAAIVGVMMIKRKLSIRRRFILLFLILSFLPLLAYRFALDLHQVLLQNQAALHLQTVQNLALILETRPELWGQTTATGQVLSHIDFSQTSIWLVNTEGQTTYVMGDLSASQRQSIPWTARVSQSLIKLSGDYLTFLPKTQPDQSAEMLTIEQALSGRTLQQYRTDKNDNPISLMSATPIYQNGHRIGAVVYEQTFETLFNQTLQPFYHLVTLAGIMLGFVLLGIILYAGSLSNRILRLSHDVKQSFSRYGQPHAEKLMLNEAYHDEISELRQSIKDMLDKLANYDRYLKQLPRTLRHELHNPINRLSASLELLHLRQPDPKIDQARQALEQLQHIIQILSQASSLEQSLAEHRCHPVNIAPRLVAYFESVEQSQSPGLVKRVIDIRQPYLTVMAESFLLEQLLDKLIDNALEFNNLSCPVTLTLKQTEEQLVIEVCNCGPLLPQGFEAHIFEGMVSIRTPDASQQTHLGLGLYIARLIADFHRAELNAFNKSDQSGVCVRLTLDGVKVD